MSRKMKNKGQTLVLTLFVVLISLGLTIVFLMPVNQQVIKLRKLLNTFQALAYSESGIEFANYYAIKGDILGDFLPSVSSSSFSGSMCEHFANKLNLNLNSSECIYTIMESENFPIELEVYVAPGFYSQNIQLYVSPYVKVISQGKFKNILRVLDFDFIPSQ